LFAESFARQLGATFGNGSGGDTLDAGLRVIEQTLTERLGVSAGGFSQVDGSGVSVKNLVKPRALGELLVGMQRRADFAQFMSLLPRAAMSGSLSHRFAGTPAAGNVYAKTGTITHVSSLSGYALGAAVSPSEPLIFSIVVNNSPQRAAVLRQAIDRIVVLLYSLGQC
jgi:serine-type D-Ala-D-Ala carboxypeptidase/endopeptidase (penicillin-binding protein 4)